MVFSLRANKKRIFGVIVILAAVILGIIFIPKMVTAPMKHYGETPQQRQEFLSTFGWKVSLEPADEREVTIPREFSDIYTKYNAMQKAQGFDLKPYSGMTCRQYIYIVENYPGESRQINATVLVYGGQIIGGDLSCAEVDGFMHGFAQNSAAYGQAQAPKKSTTESSKLESSTTDTAETSAVAPEDLAESTAGEPAAQVTDNEETDGKFLAEPKQEDSPAEDVAQEVSPEDYPTD